MFWNKKSEKEEGKLPGPKEIPGPLQNYLVAEKILPPDLAKYLRAVQRKNTTNGGIFDFRIFDDADAKAKKVEVTD